MNQRNSNSINNAKSYYIAQCNYGVRFDGPYGVDHMMEGLCKEVEKRMTNVGVKGMKVTLKVKQRKDGAPPPPKYLGHGSCHNLSKSVEVRSKEVTRNWKAFFEPAMDMFRELKVERDDVRGMGIVISKLVDDDSGAPQASIAAHPISKWFSRYKSTNNDTKFSRKVDLILPAPISDQVLEESNDDYNEPNSIRLESTRNVPVENDTSCNDIVLPALSQIHMSQVHALPSPMRKHIISEIENVKGKATSETHHVQNPMRDIRYRQTDVKRLLRLASLKAGASTVLNETGQAISLTQLQCLPLELQLDIANDDSNGYGQASPIKMSQKSHDFGRTTNHPDDETEKSVTKKNSIEQSIQLCNIDDGEDHDVMFQDTESVNVPPNFYRDDVLPLIAYMNENPEADMEAVQHVSEFLCLCVSENRLTDTVVLLQNIKFFGNNQWYNDGFESVFEIVDRHVNQYYLANLDKEWILQQ